MGEHLMRVGGVALVMGLQVGLGPVAAMAQTGGGSPPEVLATGLRNPRGLAIGPDGAIYVAEAGAGGSTPVQAGEYRVASRIGWTARVVRVDRRGATSVVLDGLPSVRTPVEIWGATGVAFVGETLYVLTAAGGRDVGDRAFDNVVLEVGRDGSARPIANLSAYNLEHPPLARQLDPRADVAGGVPYGFTALDGRLYATDGNLETVTEISLDGSLRRLKEYPASNHVLVGIAAGPDHALYFAEYGPQPHRPGAMKISRLSLDGALSDAWTGLSQPIGVAFGPDGTLYALEFAERGRTPATGRLLHQAADGRVEILASKLNFPTALAMGPDGSLYVAESGHLSENGTGRIIQVRAPAAVWPARGTLVVGAVGVLAAMALGVVGMGVIKTNRAAAERGSAPKQGAHQENGGRPQETRGYRTSR